MSDQAEPVEQDPIVAAVAPGYAFEGPALELGALMLDATRLSETPIRIPLGMVNRHGLVAVPPHPPPGHTGPRVAAGARGAGRLLTVRLRRWLPEPGAHRSCEPRQRHILCDEDALGATGRREFVLRFVPVLALR